MSTAPTPGTDITIVGFVTTVLLALTFWGALYLACAVVDWFYGVAP